MKSSVTVKAVSLLVGVGLIPAVAAEPVPLGTYRQFFIDDQIIESESDVTRNMHRLQRYSSEAAFADPNSVHPIVNVMVSVSLGNTRD